MGCCRGCKGWGVAPEGVMGEYTRETGPSQAWGQGGKNRWWNLEVKREPN